jgi:hypothetical protein
MDQKISQCLNILDAANIPGRVSIATNSLFLIGTFITEQEFFAAATLGARCRLPFPQESAANAQDNLRSLAKQSNYLESYIHLEDVSVISPGYPCLIPFLRINAREIIAWAYLY